MITKMELGLFFVTLSYPIRINRFFRNSYRSITAGSPTVANLARGLGEGRYVYGPPNPTTLFR
jgi:hypothetical protein